MIRLLPLSLLLVGCIKDDQLPILDDDDTDSSNSYDTSSDDTAGGEDTSSDANSSDDTAGEDTSANGDCDGPEDLVFFPIVKDSTGSCTECSGDLEFYAAIKNICDEEVEMVTSDVCLWIEFEVELMGDASPLEATAKCDETETTWTFSEYEQKEDLMASGTLDANSYRLVITYNDPSETDASISFTVTE